MAKHLNNHLGEMITSNKPGKSFHIKIEPDRRWGASPYFLYLWADGRAEMDDIDNLLRSIWLECCGHMSSFTKKRSGTNRNTSWDQIMNAHQSLDEGRIEEYEQLIEDANGEVLMDRKVKDVLKKGLQLDYSYDFGSTTKLQITVLEEYPFEANDIIVLLSRNERLELICHTCHKKAAAYICTECINHTDEYAFCKTCSKKHAAICGEFEEYAGLPVVNSPRMGVCAYEGGKIDKERD